MAAWKAQLARIGFNDVTTVLNSGNAVFSSKARSTAPLAQAIRDALLGEMGVDVSVIVKSSAELSAIAKENPWARVAGDPSRLLVAFAGTAEDLLGLAPVAEFVQPTERWQLGSHAAYLWCAGGILDSQAGDALLGKLGRNVTTRNWATVQKLVALL